MNVSFSDANDTRAFNCFSFNEEAPRISATTITVCSTLFEVLPLVPNFAKSHFVMYSHAIRLFCVSKERCGII